MVFQFCCLQFYGTFAVYFFLFCVPVELANWGYASCL